MREGCHGCKAKGDGRDAVREGAEARLGGHEAPGGLQADSQAQRCGLAGTLTGSVWQIRGWPRGSPCTRETQEAAAVVRGGSLDPVSRKMERKEGRRVPGVGQPGLANGQGVRVGGGRHVSRWPRFFLEPRVRLGAPERGNPGLLGKEKYQVPYGCAKLKATRRYPQGGAEWTPGGCG